MFTAELTRAAAEVLGLCRRRTWLVATAESCTGGLVAGVLTEIAGSSDVVDRGFVTYANEAKTEVLAVPAPLIAQFGAVSEPVARAMAEGAIRASRANLTIAVTGVAGPGGGSPEKPVGLVHLATAVRGGETVHRVCRFGDIGRTAVRLATVAVALEMLSQRAT